MLPRATAQYEAVHADLLEETATALAHHRQLEVMEDLLPVDNLRAIGEFNDPRPAPKKLPTPKQLRAVVVGVWDVVAEQLFGDAIRECARQGGTVAQFRGGVRAMGVYCHTRTTHPHVLIAFKWTWHA